MDIVSLFVIAAMVVLVGAFWIYVPYLTEGLGCKRHEMPLFGFLFKTEETTTK